MNLRRRLVVTALAAPALLAGCKVRTINYFPVVAARVRFANLMLDSGALDVFEGEAEVWSAIGFEGTTGFLEFDNNEKTFAVRVPDATTDLAATKLTLAGEQPYTLVAYGTLPSPQVFLAPDPTTAIGSGNFQIRLIDVSSGSTTVDIYITKPDVAIDDEVGPNFIGITSGSATVSLRFAALNLRAGHQGVFAQLHGVVQLHLGQSGLYLPHLGFSVRAANGLLGAFHRCGYGSLLCGQFGAVLTGDQITRFDQVAFLDGQLHNAARVFGCNLDALDFQPAIGSDQARRRPVAVCVGPGCPTCSRCGGQCDQGPGNLFGVHVGCH